MRPKLFLLGLILLTAAVSQLKAAEIEMLEDPLATAEEGAAVATAWFELQLKLVQETSGFSPPVAARAFGYSGVTLYEAVVGSMPEHQSLAGQLNGLTSLPKPLVGETYHWPTVANAALALITKKLFSNASSENLTAIERLEQESSGAFASTLDPAMLERSIAHGLILAEAIYDWSRTDGGHEGQFSNFHDGYTMPTGPGMWLPTPRPGGEPLPALQPTWGNNRPFVLASGAECAPAPPPEYSEDADSEFYAQAVEVYEAVANLTPEQVEIARFWADDPGVTATPPGHWISIVSQIIARENYSLAVAGEAYAKVGIAIADSFISCWYVKYVYKLLRPITYIRAIFVEPNWLSPVNTPPFPEYTSGHSVQSGAAATVLTHLLGENFAFIDHTHASRGLSPRSFSSFYEAADEAAISRLYGGIHFRAAINLGVNQGKCIGARVNALAFVKP